MEKQLWNQGWSFSKDQQSWEAVTLPHTWNGKDGQDGGNDYHRGICYYKKQFSKPQGERVYILFEGVNSIADVFINGALEARHEGGFSAWYVDVTPYLADENEVVVHVDNAANDRVYPQYADFTFYGGIYRNVSLLTGSRSHIALDCGENGGVKITPTVKGADAEVEISAVLCYAEPTDVLEYRITDGEETVAQATGGDHMVLSIPGVRLWDGVKDPFLYTLELRLRRNGQELDSRSIPFGCRSFAVDPERGFLLNGRPYPLRGVSRHQDRPEIGNALLPQHHREDIDLILEMGANSVRLAHYQHDQYFYDLCDEKGLIVWAEIPYISRHMENGTANTLSQMRELIHQNYNHPSIVVWGLSNEITMKEGGAGILENHQMLNDLCHQLDKTRLTTTAALSTCPSDEPYLQVPDLVAYNNYYGWYIGTTDMNGPWLDKFHAQYPGRPIGISEYGADACNWHSSRPEQGDYTEEYQAKYHEELIKQLYTRPYVWCSYCWNMFDFGADARDEGGFPGVNHKGLVSFDRAYKKDAFYAYKAWLSKEPFVHLCGKQYVRRCEDVTSVTVYSNLPEVELLVDGESLGVKTCEDHFFRFEVPLTGTHTLVAKAGNCQDQSTIQKVDSPDRGYVMPVKGELLNWFDISTPEGYYSIMDKLGDIMRNPDAAALLGGLRGMMAGGFGGGRNSASGAQSGNARGGGAELMANFTLKKLFETLNTLNIGFKIDKEQMLQINAALNRIPKQ